ncbi:MAG: amidase [Bryobacterales bacterium]|nr:amidase [Bryobacterales bacterium]
MNRRHFLAASLALSACARKPAFSVEEKDIAAVGDALRSGTVTVRGIVEAYLERIETIDRSGPALNAVIEVNPDALSIADALDAELKQGGPRSLLHGIPILLKDNIDTADRMKTTAGSLAMMDAPSPRRDAPLVTKLREAGAVILGKTNLSEWANIRSTASTSGWSGRGGLTRNPYALDRNTSGSSAGSGAATAASLCAAAIGTETDGSIVSPSSICGLVGIKPTVGLIAGAGIIPISHSQDTAGPMARTVRDAVLVLSAMNAEGKDFTSFLDASGLRGARLGVARKLMGRNPHVSKVADKCLDALRRAGATLVDPFELTGLDLSGERETLLYELKADMAAYLQARGGAMQTLDDLIAFNQQHADKELRWFGQEYFENSAKTDGLESAKYLDARKKVAEAKAKLTNLMDEAELDAVVATTDGPAWFIDVINGDNYGQGCSSQAAVTGFPHITVPGGHVRGLPVGFSFFGRANDEGRLIRLAYGFEQATRARTTPNYLPSSSPVPGEL